MSTTMQSLLIAIVSALGAVLMIIGIVAREKLYRVRERCGTCGNDYVDWKWRHAVRWSIVCILLLEAMHHMRWTLLPQVAIDRDYILPDIAIAAFGVVYAASLLVRPFRQEGTATKW